MFHLTHHITIGRYRLRMLDKVEVSRSVRNLADTATITLPAAILNHPLDITDRIREGDPVSIALGYDNRNRQEFRGYIEDIHAGTKGIEIRCLDPLYLFKKVSLQDDEIKNKTLAQILQTVCRQVSPDIAVSCDYDITYDKFVIRQATAYDVLTKIHEDIKADIYFHDGTLHLHPPYSVVSPIRETFDFSRNVETSDLKYLRAKDRNIHVEVKFKKPDGTDDTKEAGTTGGKKVTITSPTRDPAEAQRIADNEHAARSFDGYEGTFTAWLVPYIEPSAAVTLIDPLYPDRKGTYYVVATKTTFDKKGGQRTVTLGRRL